MIMVVMSMTVVTGMFVFAVLVPIMIVLVMTVVLVSMLVCFVLMRIGAELVLLGFRMKRVILIGLRIERLGTLDDLALNALAMTAAAGIAVPGAAAVRPAFALLLGLAMGAFFGLDQRLTVGDRDLVIVWMDFAERKEAMAVAAILDERRLQRRLYARHLGEVNIAAQLLALGSLEIKFFDAIAADHDDPGLFRVGGIDQHLVGHSGALEGGGRVAWRAQIAPPGDATVHLIRG
ncbi:hypothetical protein [Bradyrhizobium sp. Leo121]|uniref:hypothetical protein n=1 Tax=Bradyrhizobium sp. Leo121 TaxID=1571195 RepID=UPI0024BF9518|nr:hypothetical protein [Bradyrhizobium sp. Leo121]